MPQNNIALFEKISSNSDAKNILIIGVFHGEEPQGEFIIKKYLNEKDFSFVKNNLHFIPCLNPWGKKQGVRGNINGVDLNRNYPTKNWERTAKDENFSGYTPESEYETRFLIKLIARLNPDAILSLHAPLKLVNFDGPAKDIAKKISELCNYPVQEDIGYPTPGSFGTYCGVERNIPTITLEFDEEESNESLYEKSVLILDYLANYN